MNQERNELLDVVRSFIEAPDASDFVVAGLRDFEHTFGLAIKEMGLTQHTEITAMRVVARNGDRASVAVDRKITVTKGSETVKEWGGTLTAEAIYDDGWKVADTVTDGVRFSEQLCPVLVEPGRSEGLTVRAAALAEASAGTKVAFSVHNGGDETWRLQWASVELRKGPLRFLVPFAGKRSRSGAVKLEPGSERAAAVELPPQAGRVWIRLRGPWGLRSVIFALSWERSQPVEAPMQTWPRLLLHLGMKMGPLVIATILATLLTNPLAWLLYFGYPIVLLHETWCGLRLERLLARFRASPA